MSFLEAADKDVGLIDATCGCCDVLTETGTGVLLVGIDDGEPWRFAAKHESSSIASASPGV